MQDGDLATWEQAKILLVLEGCCCEITYEQQGRWRNKHMVPTGPDDWRWALATVKTIIRYAHNSVPVEVVTFTSPEIADLAASWFFTYDITVAGVSFYELKSFARSLMWRRQNIQRVIDTDPERLNQFGQFGYQIPWEGTF